MRTEVGAQGNIITMLAIPILCYAGSGTAAVLGVMPPPSVLPLLPSFSAASMGSAPTLAAAQPTMALMEAAVQPTLSGAAQAAPTVVVPTGLFLGDGLLPLPQTGVGKRTETQSQCSKEQSS